MRRQAGKWAASLEACGEPRSWGSPSREQVQNKKRCLLKCALPPLHTRARPESLWRCSISQMPAGEGRVQAVVGGPIGIESRMDGTDESWSG